MKLPNASVAIVTREKVRDYLLSPRHPVGRYKAAFFRSQGYDQDRWGILADDIRSLLSAEADLLGTGEYGTKYAIRGDVTAPSGPVFAITTIWIILTNERIPRLVTAYPED